MRLPNYNELSVKKAKEMVTEDARLMKYLIDQAM